MTNGKKKPGELKAARERHLIAAKNSEELKKIRAGQEGVLRISGVKYLCAAHQTIGVPYYQAVVKVRPNFWAVADIVVDSKTMAFFRDGGLPSVNGSYCKTIQESDILAWVIKEV